MKTRQIVYIGLLALSLGCARAVIQQEPVIPRGPSAAGDSGIRGDSTIAPTSAAQLFRPGSVSYNYRTVSVVRVMMGDTIPRADTITVTALLGVTFSTAIGDNLTPLARIDVDSVAVHNGSVPSTRFPAQTESFRVNTTTGTVSSLSSKNGLCDTQLQQVLTRTDDVIPVIRATHVGVWSDTTVSQTCRAGIQFQTRRITTYQFDSAGSEIKLLRRSTTTFSGRGVQWNQAVESAGQSVSSDTLVLDVTSRRIQEVRGVTQSQLEFKSQLRNQQFQQTTQLFIQLR